METKNIFSSILFVVALGSLFGGSELIGSDQASEPVQLVLFKSGDLYEGRFKKISPLGIARLSRKDTFAAFTDIAHSETWHETTVIYFQNNPKKIQYGVVSPFTEILIDKNEAEDPARDNADYLKDARNLNDYEKELVAFYLKYSVFGI